MKFEKTKKKEYVELGYKKEDEIATRELEMHFIELPKFIKKNPGVEGKLEQWLWLIVGKEEKIKMAEEKNEKVKRARTLLDQISSDPKVQQEFEDKLLAQYRYNSAMEGNREYGEKCKRNRNCKKNVKRRNKYRGCNREYEKMEMAKEMLKEGISIEDVIRISSINREELEEKIDNIEELIEEGNKKREEKEKIILAKKLLEKNMSIEEISEILKIDKQKIKDLKQKN